MVWHVVHFNNKFYHQSCTDSTDRDVHIIIKDLVNYFFLVCLL